MNCVSLMSWEDRACKCSEEASLGSVVIGIHIGTACIIFCVLFLVFGYRHRWASSSRLFLPEHVRQPRESRLTFQCVWSLFCSKGSQGSWSVPRERAGHDGIKDGAKHPGEEPPGQVWTPVCKPRWVWTTWVHIHPTCCPEWFHVSCAHVKSVLSPDLILVFSLCCINLPICRRSVHRSVRWSSSTHWVYQARALANTGPQ